MERILEPEVMDDGEQVLAYARADFAASNLWFVNHLVTELPNRLDSVLDLGCGPGDVGIALAQAHPSARITALDASEPMLAQARDQIEASGLTERIALTRGYLPGVTLAEASFSTVISKDMLHHLPDPAVLWREARRLGRPGAAVRVMDLVRPASTEAAWDIVESVAGDEHPVLKEDFFNSLCAAFTPAEAQRQVEAAGLDLQVVPAGERHMLIAGNLP